MSDAPALTPEQHAAREAIYAELDRVLAARPGWSGVLVLFEPSPAYGQGDAHVSVSVPDTPDPDARTVLAVGHRALYALTLYTLELEQRLAQDPAQHS